MIYGIGGVGKTSLIREVTENTKLFDPIIWQFAKEEFIAEDNTYRKELLESATFENLCKHIAEVFGELNEYKTLKSEHQKTGLIEKLLRENKTLVIIDNLETYKENDNVFVEKLKSLIEGTPSKAVLTSRFMVESIRSYLLKGLSPEETKELFIHELTAENEAFTLSDEILQQIHKNTGGLPLAIKLIAARVKKSYSSALDDILGRLSNIDFNNPKEVYEQFYKFIYWKIWKDLSKDAKKLLIILATYASEEQIKYKDLRSIFFDNKENLSNSENDKFFRALTETKKYALLESKKSNDEDWFFIHPLTKTFVKADLLKKTKGKIQVL